ncbi:MAG: UDP-N-acetylmuramoyl-L-alanyl-D-glutamate--2,6-diaminopimelate ligase [Dermatophilaceae bacterium]
MPATPGGSRGLIDPLVAVTGVCLDSRAIIPGDLYAALPGANVHGASFVAKAVELGAVAVLTDQPGASLLALSELPVPVLVVPDPRARLGQVAALVYGYASRELTMLGVTGTNGKTTTAYLLDSALRVMGHVTGLIGTIETRIGEQRIKSVRTTPESADLHALFAVMLEDGVDTCTMEVSSHALALHRVDGVRFDVAAFTNLSQDHLDFHGSMEEYYLAKASLFTAERAVQAVVCVDDEWGQRLARESQIPVVSVSSREGGPKADWQIHADGPGAFDFELIGHDAELSLRSALPGDFNRVNTAVAALVLLAAGYTSASIERALVADPQVPGRMERVILDDVLALEGADPGSMPLAVVDFAHTPDAVTAALSALRHNTSGSLIVVIGAGGDRDPGKRTAMGAAAASRADLVFVTDDNPRSEDPATIRAALMRGALAQDQTTARPAPGRIRDVGDRGTAIRAAVAIAGRGDAVVILGKGHESGQEIAGVVHPFDDRAELRAALIERAASSGPRAFRDPVGNRRGPAPADVTRGEAR